MSSVNEAGIDHEEQVFHTPFSFVSQIIIYIYLVSWGEDVTRCDWILTWQVSGGQNRIVFFCWKLKGTRPFDLTAVKFKVALLVQRSTCACLDLFQLDQIGSSCMDAIHCVSSTLSFVRLTIFVTLRMQHLYYYKCTAHIFFHILNSRKLVLFSGCFHSTRSSFYSKYGCGCVWSEESRAARLNRFVSWFS